MIPKMRWIIALALVLAALPATAAAFDQGGWDALLKRNVLMLPGGHASQVRYDGMLRERKALAAYLAATSSVQRATFDAWTSDAQLAFLINAYNAWTIELVLTAYPDLKSIKDLGSVLRSPWQRAFIPLLGETRSLDDIEHGLIRGSGRYHDPRIHFALNCASISCPALATSAFVEATLDAQLEISARKFLSDKARNSIDGNTLMLSSIFKWYRGDFEKGWHGANTLPQFLTLYTTSLGLSAVDIATLNAGKMPIQFLAYDWRLNRAL